jgi:glycosidase
MLNLLGSHDTARITSLLKGDEHALRVAVALLLTSPGAPMIYYGDEVGLRGDTDPLCRGAMQWDEQQWDVPLLEWHRSLIALRKAHPALRGIDDKVVPGPEGLLLRRRREGDDLVWLVVNTSTAEVRLERSRVDGFGVDLVSGRPLDGTPNQLIIPAKSVWALGTAPLAAEE